MAKVYIDTNFLLIPYQFKVDIFTEIKRLLEEPAEMVIVEKTFQELANVIKTANMKDKTAAKMALQLIKQKHLKADASFLDRSVDDILLSIAKPGDYVATQDAGLKRKLKSKKIKIITLKNKKYLSFG
ncbi:DNA-binding protein [Candidatus Woesearchaeota archaeon]|nr:MAG: DNA-binding protein [Candidatus Woesearchaeota archaeon]